MSAATCHKCTLPWEDHRSRAAAFGIEELVCPPPKELPPMQANVETVCVAPQPPAASCGVESWIVPPWVMPLAFKAGMGQGPSTCVNGMTMDNEGDLVLYRKLCEQDYVDYPSLVGAEEVWIVLKLDFPDN